MIIMLVVIRCFIMVFEKMHMLASMNTSSLHHHFPKHTTDLEKMNKTRTDDYHYFLFIIIIIDGCSQKFKIAVLRKELLIVLYS